MARAALTLAALLVLAASSHAARIGCPPYAIGTTTLRGSATADVITGCPGRDRIFGRGGADLIRGGRGNDDLFGGPGRDVLSGGAGNDTISGGSGVDRISGVAGFDVIDARDGTVDRISCGSGKDVARTDRRDKVSRDCERVRRSRR